MTDWRDAASCRGIVPTALFFPTDKGPTVIPPEVAAACRRCTVKASCLAEVLAWTDEADHGIRAGTGLTERRKMRGRRRKGAA